jgi:predicted dehydrogenase
VRFGILGTGGISHGHGRAILERADATLVAIADPSETAMDTFVSRVVPSALAPLGRYHDIGELIAHGIDALVIATPHTQHAGQVATALSAGIHVLCEKPLATTAADARRSIDLAATHGRVLAIGYQRHGQAQFRQARELVTSGTLGDIRLISVLIAQDCIEHFIPGSSWRADPALSGGGHFIDTGSHIVDQMLWISDLEPERVYAEIDNFGTDVDVITAASIKFTNGARATFAATSLSGEAWREELTFYGTLGTMRLGRTDGLSYQLKGGDRIFPRAASAPDVRPIDDFVEVIRGLRLAPQAPAVCGLRVAQVTEAAYRSSASGRPEAVG